MKNKKTIDKIAYEYLVKNNFDAIGYGDTYNLDEIAHLCKHTTLNELHPLDRHIRLLNYLEKSPLFIKRYYRLHRLNRVFYIKKL